MNEDYQALAALVGQDLAEKAFRVECVYKYIYSHIPQASNMAGYGWENVHKGLATNEAQRKSVREVAMMAAISIVLNLSPDVAQKMAGVIGPWFWDKDIRRQAELLHMLKNTKESK